MDALPFADGSYDVLWSEGAIYSIGFERGARLWRRFLRPGGLLVVSELTWLDGARPRELEEHWEAQYSEVGTASAKLAVLERSGYAPAGYFPLPRHCWMEGYYLPLRGRFAEFLQRHGNAPEARAIVTAEEHEIALYERHAAHVGYGVYLARRTADAD
jgi:SAM-dependent methyltransferase